MCMTIKLGGLVIHNQELPPINPHGALITWPCEVT